eukprot:2626226-Prymnesium_polylepis.1
MARGMGHVRRVVVPLGARDLGTDTQASIALFPDTERKRGTGPRRSFFRSAAGRRVRPGCRHRVQ